MNVISVFTSLWIFFLASDISNAVEISSLYVSGSLADEQANVEILESKSNPFLDYVEDEEDDYYFSSPDPSPAETDLSVRLTNEVVELYRLRLQAPSLGPSAMPPKPKRVQSSQEPVIELTEKLKEGCGGPQCIAVLLRPSATLEFAFLFGLIGMGLLAQRRGATARKLEELVSRGEAQRRKSEEMMKSLQQQLQMQESVILELLQKNTSLQDGKPTLISTRLDDLKSQGLDSKSKKKVQIPAKQSKQLEGKSSNNEAPKGGNISAVSSIELEEEKRRKLWLQKQGKTIDSEISEPSTSQSLTQPLEVVYGRVLEESGSESDSFLSSDEGSGSDSNEGRKVRLKAPNLRSKEYSKVSHSPQHSAGNRPLRRAPTSWGPPSPKTTGGKSHSAQNRPFKGLTLILDTNCYLRKMRFVRLLRKLPQVNTVVPLAGEIPS